MRKGFSTILILLPFLLAGCQDDHGHDRDHDRAANSSFDKRLHCAQFAQSGKWENDPDGPFLDETYYSPSLDTCVFVMRQSFPAENGGDVRYLVQVVDGLSRKQLWANDPKSGDTEQQIDAKLNDELTKLQVAK